jgi:hypothetical protein
MIRSLKHRLPLRSSPSSCPCLRKDSFPVRLLRRKPFPFLHREVKSYVVSVVGRVRSDLILRQVPEEVLASSGPPPDYNADQERMRLQGRMERMVEEIAAGQMLERSRLSEDLLIGSMALRLQGLGILIREWARMAGTPYHASLEEEIAVTTRFAFGWMLEGEVEAAVEAGELQIAADHLVLGLIAANRGDEVVAMEEASEEGEHGDPDQADLEPGSD